MKERPKTLAELAKFVQRMSSRLLLFRKKTMALVAEVQRHVSTPHVTPEGFVEIHARCDDLRNEVAVLGSRLTEIESARAGEDARAIADLSERVAAIQERLEAQGPAKGEPPKQAEADPVREICHRLAQVLCIHAFYTPEGWCFCGSGIRDQSNPTHSGSCLDARKVMRDYHSMFGG